ncbi:RCC1 domain-containing protein [Salinispora arenicola]|uniref:Alpha-tubulin suppressor-like RCC1 family protein n=1 Tax=Salinispora arenicola TaxID=168697 RepID=A0A542XUP2_SALAC|nr:Ig-like domain repeat protein [Salinispora arenicola]MCN0153424.1 Ig-like domain repeat protein [Salinispora arenicola]TQL39546.1 alpha-tubulin suppressor-like RCC1 family protein [Salinispora arenicola]GIM86465.1 hypothetical protein Sar04_32010 [Salinispora arenicola]
MRGVGQQPGRGVGARRAARVIAGWFCLAVVVTAVQAGGASAAAEQDSSVARHTSAVQRMPAPSTATNIALAWGNNDFGQLGDGSTTDSSTPVAVSLPAGVTVTATSAGADHGLALTSAGSVLAWGGNFSGQLGDGSTTNSSTPVPVSLPVGVTVTAVAAGGLHSLALTSAGTLLAWGHNSRGQLGDGTTTNRSTPVSVSLPAGTTVTAVAGGRSHSLAVTSAGTVLAWGHNSLGQLGDGSTTTRSTPVPVSLPVGTTAVAVAGGGEHSVGLTSAGTVLAWGRNFFGQLGDGTTADSSVPVAVSLPSGITVTAITAGDDHSLGLTSAGTVLAWGRNFFGQLGDGTTADSSTPVAVSLPSGATVTAIALSDSDHSVALTSTGAVLAWGDNSDGQLGDGTTADSSVPVAVSLSAGTTVTAIAAGTNHNLALVAPPTSSVALRVTPSNPEVGQDVTLTATVTCTGDTPAGTVMFRDNTAVLVTAPLTIDGTASHTMKLAPGEHSLTADYTSSNTCPDSRSVPVSVTVAPAPDGPDLPVTGPNLPTVVGAAALFTLAGATLIRLTGRRRPVSHQLR